MTSSAASCHARDVSVFYNHMVAEVVDDERADLLFHALADATRRDIVLRAMTGEHSVSALARAYPISLPAVQKHVDVLERAELVSKHRQGREQLVQTDIHSLRAASGVLDRLEAIWRERIDAIDEILADPSKGAP